MTTFQRQTPTSCYSIYSHFLFISLFALSITQCKSQLFSMAGNKTYEYGSTFDKNLVAVLGDLVQNTPTTGLNVSSHGDAPNRVYGLLQCRGDASSEECYNCCQNVTEIVARLCSNATECRMWYDVCELHYQNYSTSISTTSTDFISYGPGTLDNTVYNTSFQKLLYNLSVEASASSKRLAAGSSVDSSGHNIYALVQCFADISSANCSYCLSKAIEQEEKLSRSNFLSKAIYLESCFFLLSNQTAFSQANYAKQLPINLGVRGGVLVLITLLLLLL